MAVSQQDKPNFREFVCINQHQPVPISNDYEVRLLSILWLWLLAIMSHKEFIPKANYDVAMDHHNPAITQPPTSLQEHSGNMDELVSTYRL